MGKEKSKQLSADIVAFKSVLFKIGIAISVAGKELISTRLQDTVKDLSLVAPQRVKTVRQPHESHGEA